MRDSQIYLTEDDVIKEIPWEYEPSNVWDPGSKGMVPMGDYYAMLLKRAFSLAGLQTNIRNHIIHKSRK